MLPRHAKVKLLHGRWASCVAHIVSSRDDGMYRVRLEEGGHHWVQIAAGQCRVLATPAGRLCGTRGCRFLDGHDGAHSTEMRLAPRRPPVTLPLAREATRRSPRFAPPTSHWAALDVDLQASVLSHLDDDPVGLLLRISSLARNFRCMRPVVLRVLQTDARLSQLLTNTWKVQVDKFSTQPSGFHCEWRGPHTTLARCDQLDERVTVSLQLRGDCTSPRRWMWMLRLRWDVLASCGAQVTLSDFTFALQATSRLGMPRSSQRSSKRCRTVNIEIATRDMLEWHGICGCCSVIGRQGHLHLCIHRGALVIIEGGDESVIEWVLPREAIGAVQLVDSLL